MKHILFFLFLILISCGENIDNIDSTPPIKPSLITANFDESFFLEGKETRIRPVSEGDFIYLSWYQNQDEDLAGYFVERLRIDNINDSVWVRLNEDAIVDTFIIDDFDSLFISENSPIRNEYRVIAIDEDDNLSEPSNSMKYELLEKARVTKFQRNDNDTLLVKWLYRGNYTSQRYPVVKIFSGDQLSYTVIGNFLLGEVDSLKFKVSGLSQTNVSARVEIYQNVSSYPLKGSYSEFKTLQ
ncbi:MAG: hypothetical protein JXR48_04565 [Candidatus Delongbacteria bacterium]|nr:hypothetical protein [Candidatus Delongbacteria bacterium]MBN2834221.1 hypothetical protein [Candidatus Delongbacteria bacterium]